MRYYIEKWWPFVIGAVCASIFAWTYDCIKAPNDFIDKLTNSALVVCGTLLGFLLTITTILSAIISRRMDFVKANKDAYKALHSYLRVAIWFNLGTITVTIITPTIYAYTIFEPAYQVLHISIVFAIAITWAASVRFTSIFVRLLSDH